MPPKITISFGIFLPLRRLSDVNKTEEHNLCGYFLPSPPNIFVFMFHFPGSL